MACLGAPGVGAAACDFELSHWNRNGEKGRNYTVVFHRYRNRLTLLQRVSEKLGF